MNFQNAIRLMVAQSDQYILEDVSGSIAAYSLRKLKLNATKAIRVRRSNDNAELDIGFTGINLDTASLLSFAGANSCFIRTWYDQSGNNNNATQTTTSRQPNIVNNGTLMVDFNNRPTIYYSGAYFLITPSLTLSKTRTVSVVQKITGQSGGNPHIVYPTANPAMSFTLNDGYQYVNQQGTRTVVNANVQAYNQDKIITIVCGDANNIRNAYLYNEGQLIGSGTATVDWQNDGRTYNINAIGSNNYAAIGTTSELIFFVGNLSNASRQILERNQGQYYSIAVT